jgi:hypothetical protein
MATIEVPDIMVAKNGSFRSLCDGAVAKDGFKTFGTGCGVFKGGNWYVLKNNIPPVDTPNLPETPLPIVVEVTPVYDGQGYGLQARATVRDGVAPVPLSANFRLHAATSGSSGVWKDFSVTIDSGQSTMLSNWVNVGTLFGFVNDGELVSQDPATYLDCEIIWEIYHEGR